MSDSKGTGLLGFALHVFVFLSIADSIVHLFSEVKYRINNEKEFSKNILAIVLMAIRLFVSILYILLQLMSSCCRKRVRFLTPTFAIVSALIYTITLTVVMIMSCFVIDFRWASMSLICHIIAAYLSLAVTIKLLSVAFNEKKSFFTKVLKIYSDNVLAFSTLFSVVIAIALGIIIRNTYPEWNERSIKYLGFIGELFLRVLKCLVLPLIFTSLVFAMGDIDTRLFGKIGVRCVAYYLGTTVLAIILGIVLVMTIRPGEQSNDKHVSPEHQMANSVKLTTADTILDLIRNIFPDNIIEACIVTYTTVLINDTNSSDIDEWKITSGKKSGFNILGIVMFAIVLGVIMGHMKEKAKPLIDFFKAFNEVMMSMTIVVIGFTPIAVLFLVLPPILEVEDLKKLMGSVGWYSLTVMIGILFHGFVVLPLIYFLITRKNPYYFIVKLTPVLTTAFGTSSSTATVPVTMQCLEERMKLDRRVVRFCIPVGSTINMDGTALYEAVAAIFIAQYNDMDLSLVQVIIIAITATAASVGAAGIPQAGLITMVIVLNAVGLPLEDIAMVYMFDWLIDRFRTIVNVLGDAFGTGIVYHLSVDDIHEFDSNETLDVSQNMSQNNIQNNLQNNSIEMTPNNNIKNNS